MNGQCSCTMYLDLQVVLSSSLDNILQLFLNFAHLTHHLINSLLVMIYTRRAMTIMMNGALVSFFYYYLD